MTWIEERISQYYRWLRDNTVIKKDEGTGWFAVSTPFVGQFNDNIEIFVKQEGNEILLSDDGETLAGLSLAGVDFSRSAKRKEYLTKVMLNYGVKIADGELYVKSRIEDFAQKKHALISTIMELSDMAVLARDNVTSMFSDDVRAYLDELGIIYTPGFIARGKSGLDFTFDFQIAGKKSELIIKTFPTMRQNNVENFLFGLNDIKASRAETSGKELRSVAIINDAEQAPSERLTDALRTYDTHVINWQERDRQKSKDLFKVA